MWGYVRLCEIMRDYVRFWYVWFVQAQEDLTEEEVQKLRDLFDEYDVDGSGEITRDELYAIVENVIGRHTSAIMLVDVSSKDWYSPYYVV